MAQILSLSLCSSSIAYFFLIMFHLMAKYYQLCFSAIIPRKDYMIHIMCN